MFALVEPLQIEGHSLVCPRHQEAVVVDLESAGLVQWARCQPTQVIRVHQANVEPCGEGVGVGGVGAHRGGCQGRHEDNGGNHDGYD